MSALELAEVRRALVASLDVLPEVAVAPVAETPAAADAVIRGRGLIGRHIEWSVRTTAGTPGVVVMVEIAEYPTLTHLSTVTLRGLVDGTPTAVVRDVLNVGAILSSLDRTVAHRTGP